MRVNGRVAFLSPRSGRRQRWPCANRLGSCTPYAWVALRTREHGLPDGLARFLAAAVGGWGPFSEEDTPFGE